MVHLDDIQITLQPYQKLKLICMTILGLAESFKTIQLVSALKRAGPARP